MGYPSGKKFRPAAVNAGRGLYGTLLEGGNSGNKFLSRRKL